jgi:type III pantothenate kinase
MHPDFVVDVGNSRIKWGRCSPGRVEAVVSFPADDSLAWQTQLADWKVPQGKTWIVTGVNPIRRDALLNWLQEQGQQVHLLEKANQLPLKVRLEKPDHVGIDRLLNAVAANSRRPEGKTAVLIDAGSAVTVDWLDEQGAFCGGAIFPGLWLMTQALHSYTALLPLVTISKPCPALPGLSTPAAMEAGVFWTVVGGINTIVERLASREPLVANAPGSPLMVFLAGGDAGLLAPCLNHAPVIWPEITLEGIRLAADTTRITPAQR